MSTDCNAKNKLLKSVVVAKNWKAYMSSTFFNPLCTKLTPSLKLSCLYGKEWDYYGGIVWYEMKKGFEMSNLMGIWGNLLNIYIHED